MDACVNFGEVLRAGNSGCVPPRQRGQELRRQLAAGALPLTRLRGAGDVAVPRRRFVGGNGERLVEWIGRATVRRAGLVHIGLREQPVPTEEAQVLPSLED